MNDIEKLTGSYVHSLFCEMMNCEKLSEDNLSIESLDDMDYFSRLQDEKIDDDNIVSQYRKNKDGSITMYINEDLLNTQPYSSIDVIMSQLFGLYADLGLLPFYEPAYKEAHRFSFLKSAQEGYEYWFEFSCSFMSLKLLRQAFDGIDIGEEYTDEALIEKYKDVIKELPETKEESDIKISTFIYLFGKLAYLDNIPKGEIKSMLQLKKLTFLKLSEVIGGEIGKAVDDAYKMLAKSVLIPLKVYDYIKLAKLIKKINNLLPTYTGE